MRAFRGTASDWPPIIDAVEPADNTMRTWRHPWQLGLNAGNIAVRDADKPTTAVTPGAALQILPVGDMTVRTIQGQETPELLGWRIYDTTANPWPVSTYEWQADATFCRAWIIQMQADESHWPVKSVEAHPAQSPGDLHFIIRRRDGGVDYVIRRFPGQSPIAFEGESIEGDVAVICTDADGAKHDRLQMKEGDYSVARKTP